MLEARKMDDLRHSGADSSCHREFPEPMGYANRCALIFWIFTPDRIRCAEF